MIAQSTFIWSKLSIAKFSILYGISLMRDWKRKLKLITSILVYLPLLEVEVFRRFPLHWLGATEQVADWSIHRSFRRPPVIHKVCLEDGRVGEWLFRGDMFFSLALQFRWNLLRAKISTVIGNTGVLSLDDDLVRLSACRSGRLIKPLKVLSIMGFKER